MSNPESNSDQDRLFPDTDIRAVRTRGSMLWAAYADALGFVSELVDEKGLRRRTGGDPLDHLMAWKRRVGGRSGVDVQLPAGTWSDDTQLRMAVARSVNRHGFDVETFAKIEMPVWPSYALGGGRASKAAAGNLGRSETLWYANTYDGWADAGGNGAAMRVQPHAWASRNLDADYLLDVVIDSVCTHGHPRAIVGACFHATAVAHAIKTGSAPGRRESLELAAKLGDTVKDIESHPHLGSTWVRLWEQSMDLSFARSWATTVEELVTAIALAFPEEATDLPNEQRYASVVGVLELERVDQRGSGILTPVAATVLASIAGSANEGAVLAANALGTDTDTIGTMAGAILGARFPDEELPAEVLDRPMLEAEASRLVSLAQGAPGGPHHSYPDLLTWTAPQTQADVLVLSDSQLVVEGLGAATELPGDPIWAARKDFAWSWVSTAFGQTLLIKRRPELRALARGNDLAPPPARADRAANQSKRTSGEPPRARRADRGPRPSGVNLDGAVEWARTRIDDNGELGYTLRRVAREGSLTELVAFVSAIREDLRK